MKMLKTIDYCSPMNSSANNFLEETVERFYLQQQQVQEQQQEAVWYADVMTTICFEEVNVVVFIL